MTSKYRYSNVHQGSGTQVNSNWNSFRQAMSSTPNAKKRPNEVKEGATKEIGPVTKKAKVDLDGQAVAVAAPKAKPKPTQSVPQAKPVVDLPKKQPPKSFEFKASDEDEKKETEIEAKVHKKDEMDIEEAKGEKETQSPRTVEPKKSKKNEAERVLKAAKARASLKYYNQLIAENAKWKQTRLAISLFQQLKTQNLLPTVFTYSAVINACVRGGEVERCELRAKEFLKEMQSQGIEPNEVTWTTMIKGYTDVVFNTKKAFKLIEEMKSLSVSPNIRTYNTFLRGCLRTGDIRRAKTIFAQMVAAKTAATKYGDTARLENVAPDQYTFDSMVKLFAMFGELDEASTQLGVLEKTTKDVHPTVYVQLATALALGGEFKRAGKMLYRLEGKELIDSFKEDVVRIKGFLTERKPLEDFFGTGPKKCSKVLFLPRGAQNKDFKLNLKPSLVTDSEEIDWRELEWGDPSQPINMEVCTGMGSWIIDRCLKNPTINWVALEQRYDRVHQIWSKMALHRIQNLIIVSGEANAVFNVSFKKNSIDEIFINFPDPPLDVENSRTLFTDEFIENIHKVLKKNSSVTVLTDDKNYSEFIEAQFTRSQQKHTNKCLVKNEQSKEDQYEHVSFFDQLWKQRGRTDRFFCSFKKTKVKSQEGEEK